MRNGQNKRMRGRNRNKGHHGGHHHHHHHNPLTRVYESNGPEVKIRGTAHHIAEKYLQLARDATASGDHVTAENYHQHAEHYFRLIAAAQEQFRQQNPHYQPQQVAPTPDTADGAMDDGDEDGSAQPNFAPQQNLQQQNFQNAQQPYQPQQQPHYQQQQPNYQQQPQQQPYQGRPQQQQPNYQQPQPQPQYQQPPQPQQPANFDSNEGLPSFITGTQPQQAQPPQHQSGQNGYDNNQNGDRFPRHRRRRHRGGPRPDLPPQQQDFRDEGPEPGNR